jgi:oxysterol-binding protein-related protein 1/2
VVLLLERGASVGVRNGEGQTARHVTECGDAAALLLAAERTDARRRDERLLAAARSGRLDAVQRLLRADPAPSVNCVDAQGNSPLHCAAYRGHKEVAVLLLQNGVDTSIRNQRGKKNWLFSQFKTF